MNVPIIRVFFADVIQILKLWIFDDVLIKRQNVKMSISVSSFNSFAYCHAHYENWFLGYNQLCRLHHLHH